MNRIADLTLKYCNNLETFKDGMITSIKLINFFEKPIKQSELTSLMKELGFKLVSLKNSLSYSNKDATEIIAIYKIKNVIVYKNADNKAFDGNTINLKGATYLNLLRSLPDNLVTSIFDVVLRNKNKNESQTNKELENEPN